jgi:hypothetical protein
VTLAARVGCRLLAAASVAGAATAIGVSTVAAQDTVVVSRDSIPTRIEDIRRWAVDRFNAPGTLRAFGAFTLDSTRAVAGDVAVVDGPATVYGTITGDLIAINARVTLAAGAVVDGDVVVLGGYLRLDADAKVGGTSRWQSEAVHVVRTGDQLELREAETQRAWLRRAGRRSTYYEGRHGGGASLVIGLMDTYNRVEGLPLRGGLGIQWYDGGYSGRIRGYGVFRTAGDFSGSREDIGYAVEGRVRFGEGTPALTLGGRGYDLVVPTLDFPLSRQEVGWASFLWHRDYRDYFLQRGLEGFITFEPVDDLALTGEVARVTENSIAARDPWTPFRNKEPWRPNPLIDEGDFTLLRGTLQFDSRRSDRSSGSGTLLRGTWEHGLGENVVPQVLPTSVRAPIPATDYTFDRASVDLRRYQRIGGDGQFRLRGYWAGAVGNGGPLPIQRRYSLGGPDPLNGYGFRAFGCNGAVSDPAMPGLCDEVLFFQAEYRGGFGIDWFDWVPWDHQARERRMRDDEWSPDGWDWGDWFWFESPTLVLFSNAGTGWLRSDDGPGPLHWDVGAGIEFGNAGVYVAKAIQQGEPLQVTLRIERRF